MILFHELGHFLTAKWAGVRIKEFSVGIGPRIFSFRKGDTDYCFRLILFGGYVAMEGEEDDCGEQSGSIYSVEPWKRIIIMAAGGIMNIILGFIAVAILSGQMNAFGTQIIGGFDENAVSCRQLCVNDRIVAVNGEKSYCYYDVVYSLIRDSDGVVTMDIVRDGEKMHLDSIDFGMEDYDGSKAINLDFRVYGAEKTVLSTAYNSFEWTGSLIRLVWRSLGDIIRGDFSLSNLSGPVALTGEISKVAREVDVSGILMILGLVSVNLGVMNLLPLPALDGGRIAFAVIEILLGRPVNRKVEAAIHSAGIIILLVLSVFVAGNDIMNLFGR